MRMAGLGSSMSFGQVDQPDFVGNAITIHTLYRIFALRQTRNCGHYYY